MRARLAALLNPFNRAAIFAGRGVLEGTDGCTEHGVTLIVGAVLRVFDCKEDLAFGVVFTDNRANVGDDRLFGRIASRGGGPRRHIRTAKWFQSAYAFEDRMRVTRHVYKNLPQKVGPRGNVNQSRNMRNLLTYQIGCRAFQVCW